MIDVSPLLTPLIMPLGRLFTRLDEAAVAATPPMSPASTVQPEGPGTRKRPRSSSNASHDSASDDQNEAEEGSDHNNDTVALTQEPRRGVPNRNILDYVRRMGRHKRLRPDQQKDLEEFVSVRILLFTYLFLS